MQCSPFVIPSSTPDRHTATLDRTPQKIAPGRGITSKWAVLWPKWPCPKVPFPLRAKRARKAQNRTGTAPSRDGFAIFSGREIDFRWTVARCSAAPLRVQPCRAQTASTRFLLPLSRQPPPPLLDPLGESYWGVGGWRKVPLWPKICGVTPKANGYKTPKFAPVA